MNTTEQILVIFLSVALAVFLALGIVVLTQVIRLMKVVNRVADKAEHVVETAEQVGNVIKNVSGPLGVMNMVRNIVEVVQHNKKK